VQAATASAAARRFPAPDLQPHSLTSSRLSARFWLAARAAFRRYLSRGPSLAGRSAQRVDTGCEAAGTDQHPARSRVRESWTVPSRIDPRFQPVHSAADRCLRPQRRGCHRSGSQQVYYSPQLILVPDEYQISDSFPPTIYSIVQEPCLVRQSLPSYGSGAPSSCRISGG